MESSKADISSDSTGNLGWNQKSLLLCGPVQLQNSKGNPFLCNMWVISYLLLGFIYILSLLVICLFSNIFSNNIEKKGKWEKNGREEKEGIYKSINKN